MQEQKDLKRQWYLGECILKDDYDLLDWESLAQIFQDGLGCDLCDLCLLPKNIKQFGDSCRRLCIRMKWKISQRPSCLKGIPGFYQALIKDEAIKIWATMEKHKYGNIAKGAGKRELTEEERQLKRDEISASINSPPKAKFLPSILELHMKYIEIQIKGRWLFEIIPFRVQEYFICHEKGQDPAKTCVCIKVNKCHADADIRMSLINLQEGMKNDELSEETMPSVDEDPRFVYHNTFWDLANTHLPISHDIWKKGKRS
jgi:hypothetical protein